MRTFLLSILAASVLFAFKPRQAENKKDVNQSKVSFFSSTPVEDIKAHSATMKGKLNTESGAFAFVIQNTSFEFENKLMQEHFNEKYMESDKYPQSIFSGKINEKIDFSKNGEHAITAAGKLKIHGVEKERTLNGKLIVKDGKISANFDFQVALADHNIEVPNLVLTKIAKVIDVKAEVYF